MSESLVAVRVESNIERLDSHLFHEMLVRLIRDIAETGEAILKSEVPEGETGALKRHVAHHGPHDEGERVVAEIGISAVMDALVAHFQTALKDMAVPGEQSASNYPLFVDRGTGIFGPAGSPIFARRAHFMQFPGQGGDMIFRHETKGQRGQHFMLKTYSSLVAIIPALIEEQKARLASDLRARSI